MAPEHHVSMRAIGCSLYDKDTRTEWWTVPNENRIYEIRETIPFQNLLCEIGSPGGFIVYLDKPKAVENREVSNGIAHDVEDIRQINEDIDVLAKADGESMKAALIRAIEQRGFRLADCPYCPILPEWENFPIVRAIREAERETGCTYNHTPRAAITKANAEA